MANEQLQEILSGNIAPAITDIKLSNRPGTLQDADVLTKAEIQALFGDNAVSGLSLSNTQAIDVVGTSFNPSTITWNETGSPLGLLLNDSDGQLNDQSVSGGTYSGSETYSKSDTGDVTWTLSGDNVDDISTTVYWVWLSYWGVNETGDVPTEGEILAGAPMKQRTNTDVDANIVTTASQFGWVAVESAQSQTFQTWIVDNSAVNRGPIGSGNFIEPRGQVTVAGRPYDIYMFDQAKPFDNQLTLT